MENLSDQNDTFNALKYKRAGIHPKHYSRIPYTYWVNDNGELHREDGPAVEYLDGTKSWWLNGKRHREDGPAVEYPDGTKFWYVNGKPHREDGPAIEWSDGRKHRYLHGQLIRSERK